MKPLTRKVLLGAPLLLGVLLVALYLLVDSWLEGAGGRQALERALQERIGLPVALRGEFRVMLLPAIGVSGTALIVGEPGPATELLSSEEYSVALALAPLFQRRLVIDAVRFGHGTLHLERWPEDGTPSTDAPQPPLQLPEIALLEIRDFQVVASRDGTEPYQLTELSIEGFAAGRASPLRLEVEGFGAWTGSLSWNPERSVIDLQAAGKGAWPGEIHLNAGLLTDAAMGTLEADWSGGLVGAGLGPGRDVQLSLAYALAGAGLRLQDIRFAMGPLLIGGAGCLLTVEQASLHLELATELFDTDDLPDLSTLSGLGAPAAGDGGAPAGPGEAPGLDYHVRLVAAELRGGGAVARQAVLQVGGEPDCTLLDAPATD